MLVVATRGKYQGLHLRREEETGTAMSDGGLQGPPDSRSPVSDTGPYTHTIVAASASVRPETTRAHHNAVRQR